MKPTRILASSRTPDGALLTLLEHDGRYFMKVNGVQLMSTSATASEQQMADLCCKGLPATARVLVGGFGFGFTLRRVLELLPRAAKVQVVELLPEVLAWNREFLAEVNGKLLDDARVTIQRADVHRVIQDAPAAEYDAILLDVDNGPGPLVQRTNQRLYLRPGLNEIRRVLRTGGRVVFWSAHRDDDFVRALRRDFRNVNVVDARAHANARRCTHTLFVAQA